MVSVSICERDIVHAERDIVHAERDIVHAERDIVHAERDIVHAERDIVDCNFVRCRIENIMGPPTRQKNISLIIESTNYYI